MTIGTLLSVGVLYSLTVTLKARFAFPIMSILMIVWVVLIITTGMITEPQ